MITVFIDESGTLPDAKDKFVSVCGVAVLQLKEAENIFSRILNSLRQRNIKIGEIKFYSAGQNTKRQFLAGMSAANLKVFALIVDKKSRKIADTPENFSLLVSNLISDVTNWYKGKEISFVIDRHFYKKSDQNKFDVLIKASINKNLKWGLKHVDSKREFLVNTADMAAGSVLWKYRGKDSQFYNLIKENIVIEKLINWSEIKRRSLS